MEEVKEMTFGKALRKYRKKKGWTQTKLAHILGVSDSIISEWERNEKTPQQRLILERLRNTLSKEIPEVRKLTGVRLTESVGGNRDPLSALHWAAEELADKDPDHVKVEHTKKGILIRLKMR